MGGPKGTFELLVAELKLRGIAEAKEVIVVTDGASWIWNRTVELPSLLGVPQEKVTRVADFYHAVEHLQAIAESRNDWRPSSTSLLSILQRRAPASEPGLPHARRSLHRWPTSYLDLASGGLDKGVHFNASEPGFTSFQILTIRLRQQ